MLITGMSYDDFTGAVARVSDLRYSGNITTGRDYRVHSGNRFSATLRAIDSHGAGARRSHSGRHGPWACWHAYRDVLIEVFRLNPKTRVRTGLAARNGAMYDGIEGFRRNYPATGDVNVGSQVMPATMPELCECGGNVPVTAREYRRESEEATARFWAEFTSRTPEPDDYEVTGDPEPYRPWASTEPTSGATITPVPAEPGSLDLAVFGEWAGNYGG